MTRAHYSTESPSVGVKTTHEPRKLASGKMFLQVIWSGLRRKP